MANGWDGWNLGKTPAISAYQSPNLRLAQMLMQGQRGQPRQHRRGNVEQGIDFLQSGLGAYLMSRDAGQQQAATKAFTTGASGEDGLKGAMAAMQGMTGNPYAQHRLQGLLMQQLGQSQKEKQRLKELESAKDLYKFQQQEQVFPPKIPVPGRDVPFGPAVQEQRLKERRAKRTSWGPAAGRLGMMESSTGELKAIPQTPQQKAQATLQAESAKVQAEARREFPKVEQKAQEALANIKALTQHPGMKGVIGVPDTLSGLAYKIFGIAPAGTDEAGFTARLDQMGGQQFLQAFDSLRGGGAISEAEGIKASNAMSRLEKTGQSEESYLQAAAELTAILQKGLANSRAAAGLPPQPAMGQPAMGQPAMGQLTPEVIAMLSPGGGSQLPGGMVTDTPQYRNMLSGFMDPLSGVAPPPVPQGQQLSSAGQVPNGEGRIQVQSLDEAKQLPPGTRIFTPEGHRMTIK